MRGTSQRYVGLFFLAIRLALHDAHGGILKNERSLNYPYSFLKIPWITLDFSQFDFFFFRTESFHSFIYVPILLKELRRSMN